MSSSKDIYRLVPYRFFINEADTDSCKLEKLTNLFPDMKTIIELELFKFNNLTRMVDRLSRIYSVSTAIDNRDDTFHMFLGPYHLSLGPAIFSALHFKNISTALLASSTAKKTHDAIHQHQKRRHDGIIRRFRRAVRKLILIKSIIDKLRLASILTPYNQYELYTRGIYNLVLAGNVHNADSMFNNASFLEQVKDFRSTNNSDRETYLVASKYMKITALLHLISATPHLHQSEGSTAVGQIPHATSDASSSYQINGDHPESLNDTTAICCSQHYKDLPLVPFPIRRSISHQTTQYSTTEPSSKLDSNSGLHKKSSPVSRQNTSNSLPDLNINNTVTTHTASSTTTTPPFELATKAVKKAKYIPASHSNTLPSPPGADQEDVLINHISSLLTNYLSARQSVMTSSPIRKNRKTLKNKAILPSSVTNESDTSSSLSSVVESNEFDKLLLNIKTVVENKLSMNTDDRDHQNLSSGSMKTSTRPRRKSLFSHRTASLHEAFIGEIHGEHLPLHISKHMLDVSSKSHSFDENRFKISSIESDPNDDEATF